MKQIDKIGVNNMYIGQLLGVMIYVAVGMLVFMFFHTFDWHDQWLYIYMALWPFILFAKFLFWIIIACLIVGVICGGGYLVTWVQRKI